jgi:hypothetical protein
MGPTAAVIISLFILGFAPVTAQEATPVEALPSVGTLVVLEPAANGDDTFRIEHHDPDPSYVAWVNDTDEIHNLVIDLEGVMVISVQLHPRETFEVQFRTSGMVRFVCPEHGEAGEFEV